MDWNSGEISRRKLLAALGLTGIAAASGGLMNIFGGRSGHVVAACMESGDKGADQQAGTVGEKRGELVSAHDFGAKGDGMTDDRAAIQMAMDFVESRGGGYILLPSKTYLISGPLILASKVNLAGQGIESTKIVASPSFEGSSLIKTKNFDLLTLQNKWFVSEGLAYRFSISHLCLEGSSKFIKGIEIYGKGYFIDRIRIQNCWNGGFYSEAGYKGGQAVPEDMPESVINTILIYKCKGWGFDFLGPHDGYVQTAFIGGNHLEGSKGLRVIRDTSSTPKFNGKCEIGHLHIYGLKSDGFYTNVNIIADSIISESVAVRPVVIESFSCLISKIENYGIRDEGQTAVYIKGSQNTISAMKVTDANVGVGNAVEIEGHENMVTMYTDGRGSSGFGLEVNGRGNMVQGNIVRYNGEGGIGLIFNRDSTSKENSITVNIRSCHAAVMANASNSTGNRIHLSGYGNTNVIQGKFGTADDISGNIGIVGGTVKHARNHVTSSEFAVDHTGLVTVTVPHSLLYPPPKNKLQITVMEEQAVTDWSYDLLTVGNVTATDVTVKIRVNQASAIPGATARLGLIASV